MGHEGLYKVSAHLSHLPHYEGKRNNKKLDKKLTLTILLSLSRIIHHPFRLALCAKMQFSVTYFILWLSYIWYGLGETQAKGTSGQEEPRQFPALLTYCSIFCVFMLWLVVNFKKYFISDERFDCFIIFRKARIFLLQFVRNFRTNHGC